ncbi:MAG: YbhB/YbcL family Raf kinase inhibitor-like protein [Chloroflexaceae bacterium]|nr:YbhB/YbcL family Raf kinase inhibitor-like protein [Chloroflexaceae bacterium]
MRLVSPAFQEGETIPTLYTCEGANGSPGLRWDDAPASTQSFALIMDDPDAPVGTWTHWVLFDIPAATRGIDEGGTAGTTGANSSEQIIYHGPCPPPDHGPHRYFFTLYALDTPSLRLSEGAERSEVEAAMKGHILAEAQYMGRYERK